MHFKVSSLKKIKVNIPLLVSLTSLAVLALITNLLLQYYQALGDLNLTITWIKQHVLGFIISSIFIFFIYTFALSLIGDIYITSILCLCIFIGMGLSNISKLTILGEPIYPVDFYQVRYLDSLLEMIGKKIPLPLILFFILLIVTFISITRKLPKLSINIVIRTLLLLISSFMIYSYVNFNSSIIKSPVAKSGISIVLWNQPYNYDTNGFVFGLLSNLQSEVVEKPVNYNKDTVKQVTDKYEAKASVHNFKQISNLNTLKPNIIFIMSETFWDPTRLTRLTFSEDPMKNIRKIMKSYPSGWLLSPEFGGNTANVEFELLTGLSMYNVIPGSIPYQQTMDKELSFPSLVSILKDQGYNTIALHPYNKAFYKRNRVYASLGFDEFISENEMIYKDSLSKGSYISDKSVINEILHELEEKKAPLFIHTVTMQNHLPISEDKYNSNSISITGLSENSLKELETYAEGIKQTDIAIKSLIDKISNLKEPTAVVFLGDHLPAFKNSILKEAGYFNGNSSEDERALSETPLFIYSNFGFKYKNLKTLSPVFLGITLFDLLDMPIPPYYAMLKNIKSTVPGLKASVCIDSNGKIKSKYSKEETVLLNEYKLIQYDLLVGNRYSLPQLFNK